MIKGNGWMPPPKAVQDVADPAPFQDPRPSRPSLPLKGLYFVAQIVDVVVQAAEILRIAAIVPSSSLLRFCSGSCRAALKLGRAVAAAWGLLGGQHAEVRRSQCLVVRVEGTELLETGAVGFRTLRSLHGTGRPRPSS